MEYSAYHFPMEPTGKKTKKIKDLYIRNYLRHSTSGISKNARKKGENVPRHWTRKLQFNWNYFFSIYKNLIFHFCPNLTRFLKKIYLGGLYTKKNSIRTRISRWLGRENEENVAQTRNCCGNLSFPHWTNIQCNQRTTQRNKESH